MNFLASPPLVVAYALAGDMHVDLISSSLGALVGPDGTGMATLSIPPGLGPAFNGLVMHHTYLVIGLNPLTIDLASNPVSVTLKR